LQPQFGRATDAAGPARVGKVTYAPCLFTTLQKKDLVKGALNVVGETHDVSGKRRELEQKISGKFVGGSYWREYEFRTRRPTKTENFFGSKSKDARPFADPLRFRIAQAAYTLNKTPYQIASNLITLWKSNDDAFNKGLLDFTMETMGDILPHISALSSDLKLLRNNEEYAAFSTDERKTIDAMDTAVHGSLMPLHKQLQITLPLSDRSKPLPQGTLDTLQLYAKTVTDLTKLAEHLGPDNDGDVNFQRSQSMHRAAEARHKDPGVWKIGDNHVTDIKQSQSGKIPYNLMTEDEFSDYFK
jgi:hypothetical protein